MGLLPAVLDWVRYVESKAISPLTLVLTLRISVSTCTNAENLPLCWVPVGALYERSVVEISFFLVVRCLAFLGRGDEGRSRKLQFFWGTRIDKSRVPAWARLRAYWRNLSQP